MKFNSLADALSKVTVGVEAKPAPLPQTSLPQIQKTPLPEVAKVVQQRTFSPVNKQAALLLAPVKSWLSKPLPNPKPIPPVDLRLVNDLKIERNAHAITKAKLGTCRAELRHLKTINQQLADKLQEMTFECDKLRKAVAHHNNTKMQLYEQITRS